MSFFNSRVNLEGQSVNQPKPVDSNQSLHENLPAFDFSGHLEKMALFLAQTWKDEHPDATADSEADRHDCILAVTTELAIAAKAVGGPAGLAILTGGGSTAARAVCDQVLNERRA